MSMAPCLNRERDVAWKVPERVCCWELPLQARAAGGLVRTVRVRSAAFIFLCWRLSASALLANTNTSLNKIPPLRPPKTEMAPSFWEQSGGWIVLGGAAFVLLILLPALWLFFRTRPHAMIPPEVQARRALESARGETKDGIQLSRVSQIVRAYLTAAFHLAKEEMTTTEFCAQLNASQAIGPRLSAGFSDFFNRCDQRKFSPAPGIAPFDAVSEAWQLIEQAEGRRAELRRAEEAQRGKSNA